MALCLNSHGLAIRIASVKISLSDICCYIICCFYQCWYLFDICQFEVCMLCAQLGETPLHFACKFGFVEMVAILISHPGTDKQLKNVDGLLARDVC